MEEVTKCRYIDCVDTRAKGEKEEILHELPVCNIGLCVKWLINSGHVDLIARDLNALRSMKFFVCNNHFTEDCYLSKGTLKENAVPSPHWSATSKTLRTFPTERKRVRLNGNGTPVVAEANLPNKEDIAEDVAESKVETDRWCRTCATKKLDLVSMTAKRKGTEMNLLSKLKLLIEIDEEDALPTKMCDECVGKLEQSFKFFQQIYVADNTLRRVFSKREINDPPRMAAFREQWKTDNGIINEEGGNTKLLDAQTLAHKVGRGGFVKRGRGRPRTRGRPPKSKQRAKPVPRENCIPVPATIPLQLPCPSHDDNIFTCEPWIPEKDAVHLDQEKSGTTVFSLLTDTCHSDEELDWTDVLKLMNSTNDMNPQPEEQFAQPKASSENEIENKENDIQNKENDIQNKENDIESKIKCPQKPLIHCEFCNDTFKLRHELRAHLLTSHSHLSRYMCKICLGCYESSALLSQHRIIHHRDQKYTCDQCQREFLEKGKLRRHIKTCQTQYSCDICGDIFASKLFLAEHMKDHPDTSHSTVPNDSSDSKLHTTQESNGKSCDGPCESMDWADSLCFAEHDISHNEAKNDCSITTSVPVTTGSADVNACTENSPGTQDEIMEFKREQCPDCEEKVNSIEELGIHRMRAHSIERKDSTCLLCGGKPFSSPEEYEQHILEHCKRLRISF